MTFFSLKKRRQVVADTRFKIDSKVLFLFWQVKAPRTRIDWKNIVLALSISSALIGIGKS